MGELGSYLSAGRTRAGLSAEQVARETRIPLKSVTALEEERYDLLPEPVFVRGFVSAYCRAVRLDEGPAIDCMTQAFRTRSSGMPSAIQGPELASEGMHVGPRRPGASNWTHLAILLVFAIGILVALLSFGDSDNRGDASRVGGSQGNRWPVPEAVAPR